MKRRYCKICYSNAPRFSPTLVPSGYFGEYSYKCPICGTLHSPSGEPKRKEEYDSILRQKKAIEEYQKKWFS